MMNKDDTRSALVIGASGGIGGAVAATLRADAAYDRVLTASRRDDGLDITDEKSVASFREKLGEQSFDLIFVASGVLAPRGKGPEKSFGAVDPTTMSEVFLVNAIGPGLLFKHLTPCLARGRKAVFAVLSARVGSIGDNRLGGWISYRASKAALNQIVRCAAVEIGRGRPEAVVAALHPGTVETGLSRPFARGRFTATPEEASTQLLDVLERLTPTDTGKFFAYDGEEIVW